MDAEMAGASNEPSMEEILSSIKRIIAEDSEAAMAPPKQRRAARPLADPVPQVEAAHEDEVLELTDAIDSGAAEPVSPPPAAKPALVSDATAEASRNSLAALSALVVRPEITGSDTLEGMVREMLRPMLSEWLEARLPEIVERLVAQEIQRITARG